MMTDVFTVLLTGKREIILSEFWNGCQGKVFDFLFVSFYLVASLYDFEASALLECITEKNGVMEYVTKGQTAITL